MSENASGIANDEVGSGQHRVGVAPVAIPAGELREVAQVLVTGATSLARATRPGKPGDTDTIAERPSLHSVAERSHPTDHLMARHDGEPTRRQVTLDQLQVGSTHSARGHLDDDLAGPRARRIRDAQLEWPPGHRARVREHLRSAA